MVKGLREVQIRGTRDKDVEDELHAAMAVPYPPPHQCLEEATRLKDLGNEELKNMRYEEAIRLYFQAFDAMHIVVQGRNRVVWANAFFATTLGGGLYFGEDGTLVRLLLRVRLVANVLLAYLKLEDWEEVRFWGMRSINLMRDQRLEAGFDVDEPMLGFEGANSVGKIYFRTGLAYKALDDQETARELFKVAAAYLPSDGVVQAQIASVALRLG